MEANDPNSLTDLDSLSDSDWLDISSRASEDTDSVAGFDDSDREDRPPSRRSLLSTDSSHDGEEVQGWEGLVEEDTTDAAPVLAVDEDGVVSSPDPLGSPEFRSEPLSAGGAHIAGADGDVEEEERVKAALDQSMMSTLNSSRSSSLQTSLIQSRDLRLSFPDPLTSSRDELKAMSFEKIVLPDLLAADSDTAAIEPEPASILAPAAGPGAFLAEPDAYIVLHGFASMTKWAVIETLLEKMAQSVGLMLSPEKVYKSDGCLRFFTPYRGDDDSSHTRCISVLDFTEFNAIDDNTYSSAFSIDRPSLAVVFLPAPVLTLGLAEHTFYLPVLAQDVEPADKLIDAEQQWENLGVPRSKVAVFTRGSTVLDQDDLERIKPMQLARVMRQLYNPVTPSGPKRAKTFGTSPAFTIFAVLSIVLGYVIQGSVGPSHVPTPTIVTPAPDPVPPFWSLLRPITAPLTNHSVPAPATTSSTALVPSTLKELALAVLNPASVVATTSSVGSRQPSSTPAPGASTNDGPSECSCGCGLVTWPGIGKAKPSTDLAVRATPAALAITTDKDAKAAGLSIFNPRILEAFQGKSKGKGKAPEAKDDSLYALSTRIVGSLSEYLEWSFGGVDVTAGAIKDVQEIMDAIDKLVLTIRKQTTVVWEQSLSTASGVRAQVRERHDRAKRNARKLKALGGKFLASLGEQMGEKHGHAGSGARRLGEVGGQLLAALGEHVRGRVDVARSNARALREGKKRILAGKRGAKLEERKEASRRLQWGETQ